MISPDLHALGFDYPEWEEMVNALIDTQSILSLFDVGEFGAVGLYQDTSGSGVSLFQYQDEPLCTLPSLQGTRGHKVQAYQLYPSLALLDIFEEIDGEMELSYQLLACVDDPHCYPIYPLGKEKEISQYEDYQLSAVALDVQVYENEEEWAKDQAPIVFDNSRDSDGPNEVQIGPEFITSPWLFALEEGKTAPREANAATMFMGVVRSAELRTNQLTGQQWWRCEVSCGFPIIVALPADIAVVPKASSVIDGSVMLLGSSGFWDR